MNPFAFFKKKDTVEEDKPLDVLFQKYHDTPLFRDILKKRVQKNKEEVKKFINENFRTVGDSKDETLQSFITFFSTYYWVHEILSWPFITHIDLEMCKRYLTQNFDWIFMDALVSKIDPHDLYIISETYHLLEDKRYAKRILSLLGMNILPEILQKNRNDRQKILSLLEEMEDAFWIWNGPLLLDIFSQDPMSFIKEMSDSLLERWIRLEIGMPFLKSNPIFMYKLLLENPRNLISFFTEEDLATLLQILKEEQRSEILIHQNSLYEKVKNNPIMGSITLWDDPETLFPLIKTSSYILDSIVNNPSFVHMQERFREYVLQDLSLVQKVFDRPNPHVKEFILKTEELPEEVRKRLLQKEEILLFLLPKVIPPFSFLFTEGYIEGISNPQVVYSVLQKYSFVQWIFYSGDSVFFHKFIEKNIDILRQKIKEETVLSSVYFFLDKYPQYYDSLEEDTDLMRKLFLDIPPEECMKYLDSCPTLEKKIIQNPVFINHIFSSEDHIFSYLYLLNKYSIQNKLTEKYNQNFARIQKIRPELSLGNSSLKKEMLDPTFLDTIGDDYINVILQYDTKASSIAVSLHQKGELSSLRTYLDYLCKTVSDNRRMIHFYIMGYEKSKHLVEDILKNDLSLNPYETNLLKEIILQDNVYNIQSVSQFKDYLQIKWNAIQEKGSLQKKDIEELFLNESALERGVPWSLDFPYASYLWGNGKDYFQYKYVDTGLIRKEDFQYLLDVYQLLYECEEKGIHSTQLLEIQNLLLKYRDIEVPTARMIEEKIRMDKNKELNDHLIDLEEVRRLASSDPHAPIRLERKEDVEVFYLQDYDYRSLVHSVHDIEMLGKKQSTFSEAMVNRFEQYIVLGEKTSYKVERKKLSGVLLGATIKEDPTNWDLIEGISTLSMGVSSPRFGYYGLGFGKQSNLTFCGESGLDAQVSHVVRNVMPKGTEGNNELSYTKKTLYGNSRGEYWTDRDLGYENGHNQRIQPEFIMAERYVDAETLQFARHYHVPILVDCKRMTALEFSSKVDERDRKLFEQTLEKKYLYNVYLNPYHEDTNEHINFILSCIQNQYESGKITQDFYEKKLIEMKWFFYEQKAYVGMEKVDQMLNEFVYTENKKL